MARDAALPFPNSESSQTQLCCASAGRLFRSAPRETLCAILGLRKNRKKVVEIDCGGRVVLPGFVDSHTHPAFMQPRLVDFEKRIAGSNYEEIAEAGGGIRSSIEGVRKASKTALTQKFPRCWRIYCATEPRLSRRSRATVWI